MIFSWFNAKDAKGFGEELAIFYIARQIELPRTARSKKLERKQVETLEKISERIRVFKQSKKLNFYLKAQALNVFKWKLIDSGLEREVVEDLCDWIAEQI